MTAPCPDCGAEGMAYGVTRGFVHSEDCPRIGTPAQFGPPWRDIPTPSPQTQQQRRARSSTEGHLRQEDWHVGPVSQMVAVDFIRSQHYAGGAPNTSSARHALYEAGDPWYTPHGVALWLPPTRPAAKSASPENPNGVLTLSRLCVEAGMPTNAASFLLGRSMKLIDRERWPVLLTYADTRQGHTGAIYRATNWEYVGLVPGSDAWIDPDGVQRGRKRGGRNLSSKEMLELGFTRLPPSPKHKFIHRAAR